MIQQNLDIYDKAFNVLHMRFKHQIKKSNPMYPFINSISNVIIKPIIRNKHAAYVAVIGLNGYSFTYNDATYEKLMIPASNSQVSSRNQCIDILFNNAKDANIYFTGFNGPIIHVGETLESFAIEYDLMISN